MSAIETFINQAWADHVDDAAGVAARLDQALPLLAQEPEKLGALAHLVEHVLLAHLADPDAMAPWLARFTPMLGADASAAHLVLSARVAADLLRGAAPAGEDVPLRARIRGAGVAATGFEARGDLAGARAALESAQSLALQAGGDAEAIKSLAAACNNLASQLLDARRDAAGDALMRDAARLSRTHWADVGSWMNVERADYLLALCHAALGEGAPALAHARACAETCAANNADAFERFFAHEALARAWRASGDAPAAEAELARMRALLGEIADEGSRAHAQGTLSALETPSR